MKNFFPPQNRTFRYLQTNRSDRLGSLWSTFNLDFQSKLGTMRLSNKLVTNTTSGEDADLGLPVAFEFWYDSWWAICGTRIFKNNSPELTAGFVEDTLGYQGFEIGDATTQFDITNPAGTTFRYSWDGTGTNPAIPDGAWVGATVIITDTNMDSGNEGTFVITANSISGTPHFDVTNASGVVESNKTIGSGSIVIKLPNLGIDYSPIVSDMAVFDNLLWVTSATELRYLVINTGPDWFRADTFTTSATTHKMVYFKKTNRLYYVAATIGTSIKSVKEGAIVTQSGTYTLSITNSVGWISTMVANSSFIWIGGFSDSTTVSAQSEHLRGTISQWDGSSNQVTNEFLIDSGGVLAMCVVNDIPYALDSDGRVLKYVGSSFIEIARLPVVRTLLVNPTSLNTAKFIHPNGMIGTRNNTILININNLNDDAQGDVTENMPSGIWELDLATNNFTHRYSPTLKPRTSSAITDYGQERISAPGAIKINTLQSTSTNGRSTLIAGFNYFTDASTVKSGIFIDSPVKAVADTEGQKRGYFVTTWFESGEITDNWNRLWATFRRFLNSDDKISFKYRLNEEEAVLATITWTSTTTFTTTTDVSAYEGYEVEILQGTGSGSCTHITSISLSVGTYTVTLDTAITGVSGTAKARFQKWIKLIEGVSISNQVLSYATFPIAVQNETRIQIKGVLEFTGDGEFYKTILVSSPNLIALP